MSTWYPLGYIAMLPANGICGRMRASAMAFWLAGAAMKSNSTTRKPTIRSCERGLVDVREQDMVRGNEVGALYSRAGLNRERCSCSLNHGL